MKQITLTVISAWFAVTAWAGPVPFSSIKIYMNPSTEHEKHPTPEQIRRSAETVISLQNNAAVMFVRELNFPKKVKIGKPKTLEAKPLVMVVDFFYKGQSAPFRGDRVSLFCSKDIGYVDVEPERYISTDYLRKIISKNLHGRQ